MKGKKKKKFKEKNFQHSSTYLKFHKWIKNRGEVFYRQLSDSEYTKSQTEKLHIISHWYDKNNSYRVF